jgi:hypothetical protein
MTIALSRIPLGHKLCADVFLVQVGFTRTLIPKTLTYEVFPIMFKKVIVEHGKRHPTTCVHPSALINKPDQFGVFLF